MTTGTLTPAEEQTTETPVESEWKLDATQRCDRCGAQAYIRAKHPEHGELLFCNHHGSKTTKGTKDSAVSLLKAKGWAITDHSARLYESTKPDGGSAAG